MYRLVQEGRTEVFIPEDNDPDIPSASASVFYNSEMELNRDINTAVTSVYVKKLTERKGFEKTQITYLDAFAASGIRGLRVAKEVGISAVLNDWKEEAAALIQKNISHNGLEETAIVSCRNANALLHSQKFAIVDIDPFGTPSPFLDAAASSVSFLLGVTATDTAPLCGAHLKSGMRKYSAVPLNNEFHGEMGLRILIGSMARETAKFDKGIRILFSHATRHYVRVYAEILHGAKNTDQTLQNIGFVAWCPVCGHREIKNGLAVFLDENCPYCRNESGGEAERQDDERQDDERQDDEIPDSERKDFKRKGPKRKDPKRKIAGPLWLGPLKDVSFCEEVMAEADSMTLNKKENMNKLISACCAEADIPFFYDQHLLCEKLRISAPPIEPFLEKIREAGYIATRTHFSGTSFKTDAPVGELLKILSAE
ncbi:MAG: tRNA (guanine(10)-N(2))-dimethyltransferase [Methanimicrococcus sp.]|nr:tRNA (guanine(10)-N(2))-dimethyltransferase [Methanimicrococcus sp.]